MTVSDNTMQAEVLGDSYKNSGYKGVKVSNKMAKNAWKIPGLALDITTIIATAAASRNPKKISSALPEVIIFYHTGMWLFFSRFV